MVDYARFYLDPREMTSRGMGQLLDSEKHRQGMGLAMSKLKYQEQQDRIANEASLRDYSLRYKKHQDEQAQQETENEWAQAEHERAETTHESDQAKADAELKDQMMEHNMEQAKFVAGLMGTVKDEQDYQTFVKSLEQFTVVQDPQTGENANPAGFLNPVFLEEAKKFQWDPEEFERMRVGLLSAATDKELWGPEKEVPGGRGAIEQTGLVTGEKKVLVGQEATGSGDKSKELTLVQRLDQAQEEYKAAIKDMQDEFGGIKARYEEDSKIVADARSRDMEDMRKGVAKEPLRLQKLVRDVADNIKEMRAREKSIQEMLEKAPRDKPVDIIDQETGAVVEKRVFDPETGKWVVPGEEAKEGY